MLLSCKTVYAAIYKLQSGPPTIWGIGCSVPEATRAGRRHLRAAGGGGFLGLTSFRLTPTVVILTPAEHERVQAGEAIKRRLPWSVLSQSILADPRARED